MFKFLHTVLLIAVASILNAADIYQTTAELNLRSGPNYTYTSIGVVKSGEKVSVIEKTNPLWYKIECNGKNGYVSSRFLNLIEVEKPKIVEPPKVTEDSQKEAPKSDSTFTVIVLSAIVILVIYVRSNRKKSTKAAIEYSNDNAQSNRNAAKEALMNKIRSNVKIEVSTSNSKSNLSDDSIIDVTGNNSYKILPVSNLKRYNSGVPTWAHHYVYSYSELNGATNDQKKFYQIFRTGFLNGEHFDLEGNLNYAFILLFDLLNEYESHKNISSLEKQLQILGECYPKTRSYGVSFLIEKMESKGDSEGLARLRTQGRVEYQNNYTDNDYWKLGSKYKTKLNLKDEEVALLNKLWYPSNNFSSIEYCRIEILKFYIATIAELKSRYIQEGTTLDEQFLLVADVIARKQFKFKTGSNNYKYSIDSTTNEFYLNIFKYCENAVREQYGHKRKINTDNYYTVLEAKTEFETKIIIKVKEIIPILVSKMNPPDEATEMELYSQNTSRWKIKFEELTAKYNNSPQLFIDNIILLGKLNKKNPSVENIFFEASKFISKYDSESALKLYIHYLFHDLQSATFDNKELAKTIQKHLFKTNEQIIEFKTVVAELIKNRNLDRAIEGVSNIFAIKRKKIQLDTATIQEVQQQHSGTVELLNEYLKDDDENSSLNADGIGNNEAKIELIPKADEVQNSTYTSDIVFTPLQIATLDVFAKSNFSVSSGEFEIFAKSNGVFKNQLIDRINEICYDNLDDVLIEEEEDHYIINPNYYQKLLAI